MEGSSCWGSRGTRAPRSSAHSRLAQDPGGKMRRCWRQANVLDASDGYHDEVAVRLEHQPLRIDRFLDGRDDRCLVLPGLARIPECGNRAVEEEHLHFHRRVHDGFLMRRSQADTTRGTV